MPEGGARAGGKLEQNQAHSKGKAARVSSPSIGGLLQCFMGSEEMWTRCNKEVFAICLEVGKGIPFTSLDKGVCVLWRQTPEAFY